LKLSSHGVELLDVATGSDEIFGHDLAGVLSNRERVSQKENRDEGGRGKEGR